MFKNIAALLIGALVLACLLQPHVARPAPKAESAAECALFTDMALTARAIAIEGGPKELTFSIMARIYVVDERGAKILDRIVSVAHELDRVEAKDYAAQLFQQCTRGRGNMDGVLGADV